MSAVLVVVAKMTSGLAGARVAGVGVAGAVVAASVATGVGVDVDVAVLQARETTRVNVINIRKLASFNFFNCRTPF